MRGVAVLVLPTLAVLALVSILAVTPGAPKPAIPGIEPAFVWKKHSFSSKGQFEDWLQQRHLTYAGWRKRHPGAHPPWEDDNQGVLYLLLVAVVAGGTAWLVGAHDSVWRIAEKKLSPVLSRVTTVDDVPAPRLRKGAVRLREAVSVYGVRPSGPPKSTPEPELLLVEEPETAATVPAATASTGGQAAPASPRQRRRSARRRRPEPLVEVPSDVETASQIDRQAERPTPAAQDPVAPEADAPRPPAVIARGIARYVQMGDDRFGLLLEHSDLDVSEVTCRVQNPDGIESATRRYSVLLPRHYGLVYPTDFEGAPPVSEGLFHVEWLAAANGHGRERLLATLDFGAVGQDVEDDFA